MNKPAREAVHHEPIVSETLRQNAANAPQPRPPEEALPEVEQPRKQHGDALLDGSGTRHGVHDAQERPDSSR